ncbi:MAG: replication-relaxation family protein [bacterium]|jgi:predicted transcriptional regulator
MKSRIKRTRDGLKPIKITQRDREILRALSSYHLLFTAQIHRLLFSSVGRARKRLNQLWQHGLVKRIYKPVRLGEGSAAFLYALTRKAALLTDAEKAGNAKLKRATKISGQYGEHLLRINDFRICLTLACRKDPGSAVRIWKQSKDFNLRVPVRTDRGYETVVIIPDGFFQLKAGDRSYSFFLEIDRGTTDLTRIRAKISGYLTLWGDKALKTKSGIESAFRVLFVTTGEKRRNNMLALMEPLAKRHLRPDVIYFTDFSQYSLERPESLLDSIWWTVTKGGNPVKTGLIPSPIPSKLPTVPGIPPVP